MFLRYIISSLLIFFVMVFIGFNPGPASSLSLIIGLLLLPTVKNLKIPFLDNFQW